jgi:hypothetical protein
MRLTTTVLALAAVLLACGPRAPDWDVYGSDGLQYRLIECRHMADCLARAHSICKERGWIDNYGGRNPRAIMIRCKNSAADLADYLGN